MNIYQSLKRIFISVFLLSILISSGCDNGSNPRISSHKLDIRGDKQITDVKDESISSSVYELANNCKSDCFIILERNDGGFIQTYFNEDKTFTLEYKELNEPHQYTSTDTSLAPKDIISIFIAYKNSDPNWKGLTKWEALETQ